MEEPSPLVDPAWLAAHLDDAGDRRVRIADVRWYLKGKSGAAEYALGHIPGAVFVDLGRDLAARPAPHGAGRHPLPSPGDFAGFLARLGVERDTLVVAYDDAGGSIAARLWWLLRWFGHGGGRVLDGGIGAWLAAGHPLSTEVPDHRPRRAARAARPGSPASPTRPRSTASAPTPEPSSSTPALPSASRAASSPSTPAPATFPAPDPPPSPAT